MLETDDDPDLAVYVIWSPQLGAEEHHVAEAAELMPDPRALHFWDPERLVGAAFADTVGTSAPAWDVWLLFDRDSEWPAVGVPEPAWWEHQLDGLDPERHLDPERFAARARRLLDAGPGGSPPSSRFPSPRSAARGPGRSSAPR